MIVITISYEKMIFDGFKVISNDSMEFDNPNVFDDLQVFEDPKVISSKSMEFDNPKV